MTPTQRKAAEAALVTMRTMQDNQCLGDDLRAKIGEDADRLTEAIEPDQLSVACELLRRADRYVRSADVPSGIALRDDIDAFLSQRKAELFG